MPQMRHTVADVMQALEDFAPLGLAEEWDSVGLQVGDPSRNCHHVSIALDLTMASLEASLTHNADLIITHHPLFFRPLKSIRFDQAQGHLIQRLCEEQLCHYAAHTNLDSTEGGLNDHLADLIDLQDRTTLLPPPATTPQSHQNKLVGLGRVGSLKKPGTLKQLAESIQQSLEPAAMRIIGHDHEEVAKVALCTGSGGSFVTEAISSGADCFITGDVKYHQALDAEAAGMAILDVGHYASEITCVAILSSFLKNRFGDTLQINGINDVFDPIRPFT